MPTDWNKIAASAGQQTDDELKKQISSLSRLNDAEIEQIIHDTGISQQELVKVLQIVKDATLSNEKKANAINGIGKGVDVIVSILTKLV
jgi:DNA-binding transcriptional regulator YiaG